MSVREKSFLLLFLVAGSVLCYFVVESKGLSQVGNSFSFLGGLATLVPPFNQLRSNRSFTEIASMPSHPELAGLDDAVEEERRKAFMSFKPFDYILVVGGLLLMSLGFLLSILTSADV